MAKVTLDGVVKSYGNGMTAVHGIDLAVEDREFVVLVGPSGCGKSTTLRMIAGLEDITGGTIRIGDRVVNDLPARQRDISMVFQNYALYPHLTVFDNMAFGLSLGKTPKSEIETRVRAAADTLGIGALLERKPKALSGGQRQRVAMGRAIVRHPSAFLFDEPLSNLDAELRTQMRSEIKRVHQRVDTTTIYVTHDQVEAMTLADRIVVLNGGHIMQVGTPHELYTAPANTFVAQFIGSPKMNLLPVETTARGVELSAGKPALPVPVRPAEQLGIRPEALRLVAPEQGLVTGKVALSEYLGADLSVYVDTERAGRVTLRGPGTMKVTEGETVGLTFDPSEAHLFDASGDAIRGEAKAAA